MTLACLDGVTDPRNIGSVIVALHLLILTVLLLKKDCFLKVVNLCIKPALVQLYFNIFKVSNINSTLKFREKIFGYMVSHQKVMKISQIMTGKEIMCFCLDLKDTV